MGWGGGEERLCQRANEREVLCSARFRLWAALASPDATQHQRRRHAAPGVPAAERQRLTAAWKGGVRPHFGDRGTPRSAAGKPHQDKLPRRERLSEPLRKREEVSPRAEDAVHEHGGGRVLPWGALRPADLRGKEVGGERAVRVCR